MLKHVSRALPLLLVFCSAAAAQNPATMKCGPAPNRNVWYTKEFVSAVSRQILEKKGQSVDVAIPGFVEGMPDIGFKHSKRVHKSDIENMNRQTSEQYIQKEITDQRSAIVSECLFNLCTMGDPNVPQDAIVAARADIVSRVCESALTGQTYSTPGSTSEMIPSPSKLWFHRLKSPKTVTGRIFNNTDGDLKFLAPNSDPTSFVQYQGPAKFLVKSKTRSEPIKFRLLPPNSGQFHTFTASFPRETALSEVEFRFLLVRDEPEIRRPPGCDLLLADGACGRCTFDFQFTASAGISRVCPNMGVGPKEVALRGKFSVDAASGPLYGVHYAFHVKTPQGQFAPTFPPSTSNSNELTVDTTQVVNTSVGGDYEVRVIASPGFSHNPNQQYSSVTTVPTGDNYISIRVVK